MTLTALLKPVVLSINFLPPALSLSIYLSLRGLGGRPAGCSGALTEAQTLVIVIPRVSD